MIAVRRVKEGVVMIELHLLPVSKPQTGEYPIGAGSQPERTTHCATRPAPRSLGVTSRRRRDHLGSSALPPTADILNLARYIRFVKADLNALWEIVSLGRSRARAPRFFHECLGLLGSGDRQFAWVEETDLSEHTGLIPIDMLVGHFVPFKFHHDNMRHRYSPAGRRNTRKHVINGAVVREIQD